MRSFLTLLLFFSTITASAGGFIFPNVEYTTAKLYYFNIFLGEEPRFDFDIYNAGVYADSKYGYGYDLNKELLDEIHGVMARGVDELRVGLSKCYIPRHGIIYYDKDQNPVASFSVCFECEKISFWSKTPLHFHEPNYENFDIDKAERQIKTFREAFVKAGAFVSDSAGGDAYELQLMIDQDHRHNGQMVNQDPNLGDKFPKKYSYEEVKAWAMKTNRFGLKEDINIEISAGGDEYRFKELVGDDGTNFLFSSDEEDCHLVEAKIYNSAIKLPNGVSCGMSFEQVMNTFGVYDGLAFPKSITLMGGGVKIVYEFKHRSLESIQLVLPN